jgi:flagellar assembly protein FliH
MSKILRSSGVFIDNRNIYKTEPPKFETDYTEPDLTATQGVKTTENALADAQNEAESIIKTANIGAEAIIAAANAEAAEVAARAAAKARDEGYDEGFNQGFADGKAEAEELRLAAADELDAAKKEKLAAIEAAEGDIVSVIISLVEKIVSNAYQLDRDVILTLVRVGLLGVKTTNDVRVRVCPGDYEFVSARKSELMMMTEGLSDFEIIRDFSLNGGDCIIETQLGSIDASLGAQIQNLKRDVYHLVQ